MIFSQKQRVKKKNQFLLIFIHAQEQYLSDKNRSLSLASEEKGALGLAVLIGEWHLVYLAIPASTEERRGMKVGLWNSCFPGWVSKITWPQNAGGQQSFVLLETLQPSLPGVSAPQGDVVTFSRVLGEISHLVSPVTTEMKWTMGWIASQLVY